MYSEIMLKRILSLVLCFTVLFAHPLSARADEINFPDPPPLAAGEKPVGSALSPMKKGDKAPFTGVLLSPKAIATLIAQLDSLDEQVSIEVDRAKAQSKAQSDFALSQLRTTTDADKKILQAQVDAETKQVNALQLQLSNQPGPPNVMLWTGGGVIGGVVLTVLTVFAVSRATK